MYKIFFKQYKDLENHELFGKIVSLERIERRAFLYRFYNLYENHLDISQNYSPILQEHFIIKKFLKENLIEENSLAKIVGPIVYLNQNTIFKLKNFNAIISSPLWKEFVKISYIKQNQKKFIKLFFRMENNLVFFFIKKKN